MAIAIYVRVNWDIRPNENDLQEKSRKRENQYCIKKL